MNAADSGCGAARSDLDQAEREADLALAAGKFVAMRQRWSQLLFLHWQWDHAEIQRRLPNGLEVDTWNGSAFLGVVPFLMQRVRPAFCPPLPWLSWFHELNLRTYVRDRLGRPGVWFFSLECDQPIAVKLARNAFKLRYLNAQMSHTHQDGWMEFQSLRTQEPGPNGETEARFHYRPALREHAANAIASPGSLEWFLLERYRLFAGGADGQPLISGIVEHQPYRSQKAIVREASARPITSDSFAMPNRPPDSQLVAAPVDVKIFLPTIVG